MAFTKVLWRRRLRREWSAEGRFLDGLVFGKEIVGEREEAADEETPGVDDALERRAGLALLEESGQDDLEEEEFQTQLAHGRLGVETDVVGQKAGEEAAKSADRQVDDDEYGESEEEEAGSVATEVPENGVLNHLLDGIELGVVEVSHEPEDTGSKNFAEEENEGREVEDEHDPNEPVKEHRSPGGSVEAQTALTKAGREEGKGADVQPPAAAQREDPDLQEDKKEDLQHQVHHPRRLVQFLESEQTRCEMEDFDDRAEGSVAEQRRQDSLEPTLLHRLAHAQTQSQKVTHVVRREREHQHEQRIQTYHPEHVLQEHQTSVQAQQSLPRQFVRRPLPLERSPLLSSSTRRSVPPASLLTHFPRCLFRSLRCAILNCSLFSRLHRIRISHRSLLSLGGRRRGWQRVFFRLFCRRGRWLRGVLDIVFLVVVVVEVGSVGVGKMEEMGWCGSEDLLSEPDEGDEGAEGKGDDGATGDAVVEDVLGGEHVEGEHEE